MADLPAPDTARPVRHQELIGEEDLATGSTVRRHHRRVDSRTSPTGAVGIGPRTRAEQGAGRARRARHAPRGLRLRGRPARPRTAWPAWSSRRATPGCARWSACRDRSRCSRSGSTGRRSRRSEWLPRMAAGDGDRLLRPDRARLRLQPGRDAHPRRADGDDWVLNGTKMWITNGVGRRRGRGVGADRRERSAASSFPPTPRVLAPRRSSRRCRCAPRSPPSSSWTTSGCPATAVLPGGAGSPGRCRA